MSTISSLTRINDDIKEKVRQIYNKSEEDIKIDVKILLEWLKKQKHLPSYQDVGRIERFLLRNKFQIERTKLKLDHYFTYRGLYSEFFVNVSPASAAIRDVRKSLIWAPMPQLLPTMERIIAVTFLDKEATLFNVIDTFTYILFISDILICHDYASAYRVVADVSNISLQHIKKLHPNAVSKGMYLYQEAFSGRLSYIEFINLPPVFDILFALLKRILPAKLINKMRTYKNFEVANEEIPKEYMPKEFGGDNESIVDMHEKWGKELCHQIHFLEENNRKVSNENLRVGKPIRNELFGVEGTFKKLNVD